jgi:methylphosphotriester-DNA--protein-cysteine methyltransferase
MAERLFLRLEGDPLYAPETSVPAGTLREFAIDAPLAAHVAHIASYREDIPAGQERIERVLPDGAVHLIFHLGDEPPMAEAARAGLAGVAGASASPTVLRFRGQVAGLSVSLRPGAIAALLGIPAGEITNTVVALDDLWGPAATPLIAQLQDARTDEARVAIVQATLRQRLQAGRKPAASPAAHAAQLIATSGGQRALRDVAAAVGVGERRLQQLFHAEVGLSPRSWGRLARLHGCLRALRQQASPRWAELALDAGFYDQAHLVNEFQSLCGLSPRLFLARAQAAAPAPEVSGFSNTGG